MGSIQSGGEIRTAVERLEDILVWIPVNRKLETFKAIELYRWLIDFESICVEHQIRQICQILLRCLERQNINSLEYETLQHLCAEIKQTPASAGGAAVV